LSGDVQRAITAVDPFAPFEKAFAEAPTSTQSDPLEPFVYAGMKLSLPANMLVKVDRMSMANSLEVRVPFLDHKLVEFVAELPIRQRYSRHRLKWLLREAMRGKLPDDILDRPKHGFTIPLSAWLRGDLTGYAADVLLSGEARRSGYYDSNAVASLLSDHRGNRANLSGAIWMLLVFELWRRDADLSSDR
jgi:asparagine synthase (glutamine-hydrolysing)